MGNYCVSQKENIDGLCRDLFKRQGDFRRLTSTIGGTKTDVDLGCQFAGTGIETVEVHAALTRFKLRAS